MIQLNVEAKEWIVTGAAVLIMIILIIGWEFALKKWGDHKEQN